MKKAEILVTGGSGFFGLSLLDMIARGNWGDCHFTMLSRRADAVPEKHPEYSALANVDFISADVRKIDGCSKKFDYIIHAAAPSVDAPDDDELASIILDGTRAVLTFARSAGVKKILYISSGAVYGHRVAPGSETSPCQPQTVYGRAKLEAEKMVLNASIPAVIMRGFAFTGKHLRKDAHFAVGNFIADALAGRDILIKGDGTPLRSYMHSNDLAVWMMTMLLAGRAGEIYNCGSNEAVSIKDLARKVNSLLNPSGSVRVLTPEVPDTAPSCYVPDTGKAERELGLKMTIPFDEAIKLSAR